MTLAGYPTKFRNGVLFGKKCGRDYLRWSDAVNSPKYIIMSRPTTITARLSQKQKKSLFVSADFGAYSARAGSVGPALRIWHYSIVLMGAAFVEPWACDLGLWLGRVTYANANIQAFRFLLLLLPGWYTISAAAPVAAPQNVGGGGGSVGILSITWNVSY